ncbi:MAG: copper resistance protein [Acetobacteraceae bacterium]|jgi:methionine-rich copper-binding protein CopC|nr:copper resistance protein [Acetobacteraceae bacterium]
MIRVIVLAVAACLMGQAAFAHAFLDRASPAVGSEVSGSPPRLDLTYTEPVEPLFSTVEVTDANGARVDEGRPATQDDGRVLSVKLKTLPPGVYAVTWHVTSVDTHKTEGHFTFTVKR